MEKTVEKISDECRRKFGKNLRSLILYGSWVKGTAHRDSDIDLLAVFNRVGKGTRKLMDEVLRSHRSGEAANIIPTSLRDFRKERIPLFTAVKNEGKIIYGNADLSVNPQPPAVKYADFFKASRKLETGKVKMAEEILEKHPDYGGSADICFVAAKHAVQAALAMKGEGYSSKVKILLPLAKKHLGREVADNLQKLFILYVKSEYGMKSLNRRETRLAIQYAKKVFAAYEFEAIFRTRS